MLVLIIIFFADPVSADSRVCNHGAETELRKFKLEYVMKTFFSAIEIISVF